MEEWEREHIRRNLPKLTKVTRFRQSLLDKLKANGVIGDEDIDEMKRDGLTEYERISKLYDIVQTRDKGFDILTRALLADSQTGAYRNLQQGLDEHSGSLPDKLQQGLDDDHSGSLPDKLETTTTSSSPSSPSSILSVIEELLEDVDTNILIVSTPDLQISLKRIAEGRCWDHLILHDDTKARASVEKLEDLGEERVLAIQCDNVKSMLQRLMMGCSKTNLLTWSVILLTTESEEEIEGVIAFLRDDIIKAKKVSLRVVREDITGHILSQKEYYDHWSDEAAGTPALPSGGYNFDYFLHHPELIYEHFKM